MGGHVEALIANYMDNYRAFVASIGTCCVMTVYRQYQRSRDVDNVVPLDDDFMRTPK